MPAPAPREILHRWVEKFNDAEAPFDLYADDGVLLATFSPEPLRTRAQIKAYLEKITAGGDLRVTVNQDSVTVQPLAGDCYALTGLYVFQIGEGDAATRYPSRFTFVVDVSKERPILHHHSSQAPQGIP